MPLYEYRCRECGHVFEVLQRLKDAPKRNCDVCKKGKLDKLISRTSFQLKGGGWFSQGYGPPAGKGSDGGGAAAEKVDRVEKVEKVEKKDPTPTAGSGSKKTSTATD